MKNDAVHGETGKDETHVGHPPTRYANSGYRYYVLAVLTLVYTFNFIDRQLLVILQEPVKADLGLSDTQLGLHRVVTERLEFHEGHQWIFTKLFSTAIGAHGCRRG
jgi:hypothetical protein